ncbi:MAG: hypothetical protein EOO37_02265 [Cytophagaceae bacterium]|nr:MAG: hypothetical protein EOO37_02265 [Cytophagaceae bacterium]
MLLATTTLAQAQTRTPIANARERHQKGRINQGVASGELTRREAARMRGREAGLTAQKRAAKADGVVTREERQDIRRTENRDSRAIYRQKHDAQVR